MTNPSAVRDDPKLELAALRESATHELIELARGLDVLNPGNLQRHDLMLQIMQAQGSENGHFSSEGVLEVLSDGFGFLRGAEANYYPGRDDVYVSPSQIRKFDLRTGDSIVGRIRAPRNGERYFALAHVESVNLDPPQALERKSFYEHLTPLHPEEKFDLQYQSDDLSTRIMDMLCPIGKGQRALIVSPPRAGKTMLLQSMARAITTNHPEAIVIVLLIDERPEEVTEMQRSVAGEVVASCFDEPAERHAHVSEIVIEKAKRLAEHGKDVVILLDSITRLARAHNTICPPSSKVLSGGVDAGALHKPKRFFGAARNIEEGGSLTIVATALVDTGSRMDDVIFEEFKGTGNSEIVLDRKLADRRIWPAIDINRSGTRKEELLLRREMLNRIWVLRKVLQPLGSGEAIQLLLERLSRSERNEDFLAAMNSSD